MSDNPGSPVTLGIAEGRIVIDFSQVSQSRAQIVREADLIERALNKTGQASDNLEKKVKNSASGISAALDKFNRSAGVLGATFGVIGAVGAVASDRMKAVEIRLEAITGSAAKARDMIKTIETQAKALGQPAAQAVQNFAGLVPYIKGGTAEMEKLISVVTRLTVIDPAQGFEGAALAVKEAFGGSTNSLVQRFEFGRDELNQALASGKSLVEVLDEILIRQGLSDESAKKIGKTFTAQLTIVRDEATKLLGNMFGPAVDSLVPLLTGFNEFLNRLNETNPAILQIVGGFGLVLAGVTAITFASARAIDAFKNMKDLANKIDFKGVAGKVAAGALLLGATTAGISIGTGIVEAGNVGGINDRAKAQGKTVDELLGDDFKKVIGLLVTGLVALGATVQKIVERLAEIPNVLINFARNAAAQLTEALERGKNNFLGHGYKTDKEIAYDAAITARQNSVLEIRENTGDARKRVLDALGFNDLMVARQSVPKPGFGANVLGGRSLTGAQAMPEPDKFLANKVNEFVASGGFATLIEELAKSGELAKKGFLNPGGVKNVDQARQIVGDNVVTEAFLRIMERQDIESRVRAIESSPLPEMPTSASGNTWTPTDWTARDTQIDDAAKATASGFLELLGLIPPGGASAGTGVAAAGAPSSTGSEVDSEAAKITEEGKKAFTEFLEDIQEIEADADQEREQAVSDHEKAKTKLEADQQKEREKLAKDEQKRREKAARELETRIADVRKKGIERQADEQRAVSDKVRDLNVDYQKDQQKRLADHLKEMERLDRESKQRLQDAAQRLDAIAVANELRTAQDRKTDAEERFRTESDEASARLQEAIQAEKDASARRLQEAAANDEREIQQMRERFAIEEAENARIFQEKMSELVARQAEERALLDDQHKKRLEDIAKAELQAKEEREKRLNDELANQGVHQAKILQIVQQGQLNVEAAWQAHMARLAAITAQTVTPIISSFLNSIKQIPLVNTALNVGQNLFSNINRMIQPTATPTRTATRPVGSAPFPGMAAYALGTSDIPMDGVAMLHAGEIVGNPEVGDLARRLLGNNFSQGQLAGAIARGAGGGRGGGISIGSFSPSIVLGDIGQRTDDEIMSLARRGMDQALNQFMLEHASA